MVEVLALVLGYLLGSIPFGLVLTRLGGYGDIRKIGSGNIGATNVLRTGNKALALATLLLDGGKGAAAAGLGYLASDEAMLLAAGAAFLGHLFPVWLGFKGGKGVATFLGILLAVSWPTGIAACLAWLAMAGLFRISSLSALTATALAPFSAWYFDGVATAALAAICGVVIFFRHHENIRRLLAGSEPRIGQSKTKPAEPAG
ncbi:MAG: glycerol-3-phosphate 1-O-acyltransferase PlsY [Alphaproteobacteria bacterium]|nr:glycerol-3-phosphate 1-O-acyltransferase PlsY [Alphaproteobacteria bacterium]